MTNPNDAVGTNAAYGGRTSVNAFNDSLGAWSRGIISGWGASAGGGMSVDVGGDGATRDIAVAQDNVGNKTTVNNISGAPINVEIATAPVNNPRIDVIVVYVDNPATGVDTVADNPSACGIIAVEGTPAASPSAPSDGDIRTAITADGASGSTAYYVIIARIAVAASVTVIDSSAITQGSIVTSGVSTRNIQNASIGTQQLQDLSVTNAKLAGAVVKASNIDWSTISAITIKGSYGDSSASAGAIIALDDTFSSVGGKLTTISNSIKIGAGVSKVLVTASVFYSKHSDGPDYGWFQINKNGEGTGQSAITNLSSNGYSTATIGPFLLNVQENDLISLWNREVTVIRGNSTWLTVVALG